MSRDAFDHPGEAQPVEGEVALMGPGKTGLSLTPEAARQTAANLETAARAAEDDSQAHIDLDDAENLERWASRLGVSATAVRNAAIEVGSSAQAVWMRLTSARGAAD